MANERQTSTYAPKTLATQQDDTLDAVSVQGIVRDHIAKATRSLQAMDAHSHSRTLRIIGAIGAAPSDPTPHALTREVACRTQRSARDRWSALSLVIVSITALLALSFVLITGGPVHPSTVTAQDPPTAVNNVPSSNAPIDPSINRSVFAATTGAQTNTAWRTSLSDVRITNNIAASGTLDTTAGNNSACAGTLQPNPGPSTDVVVFTVSGYSGCAEYDLYLLPPRRGDPHHFTLRSGGDRPLTVGKQIIRDELVLAKDAPPRPRTAGSNDLVNMDALLQGKDAEVSFVWVDPLHKWAPLADGDVILNDPASP